MRIYYSLHEIGTVDIARLFGVSRKTAVGFKREAQKLQNERNTPYWDIKKVNTKVAFEAWGLDIKDLEMRCFKLLKLKDLEMRCFKLVKLEGRK